MLGFNLIKTTSRIAKRSLCRHPWNLYDCRISSIYDTGFRCLATTSRKQWEENNKQVVIRQEAENRSRLRPYAVDWKGLKRTWKYFTNHRKMLVAMLTFRPDIHEGRLRVGKKDHIVYYFRTKEDLDNWYVMTDEDIGGHSWAEHIQGPNEMTCLFRGYLNQKPPGHLLPTNDPLETKPDYKGSVFLETKPLITYFDKKEFMSLDYFNCIKIRFRGDGRRYLFEMVCDVGFDIRMPYLYPIFTRGGPLWQEIEIPYVKFIARKESYGTLMLKQRALHPDTIENFRFLLNDDIEGPFQLEIDYIAFTRNFNFPFKGTDNYNAWEPIDAASGS